MNTTTKLIALAIDRDGTDIYPCGGRACLSDCVTTDAGFALLWYSDSTGSTHIVRIDSENNTDISNG